MRSSLPDVNAPSFFGYNEQDVISLRPSSQLNFQLCKYTQIAGKL